MRLLVTRPEPDAERTAAALRERGHDALVAPLLRIAAVADAELGTGPWAVVLMTSASAARAIATHRRFGELRRLPLFTVGRQSAQTARDVGFLDVASADGNARDLAALVARRFAGSHATFIYLAGEDRAADLAEELGRHGHSVATVVVYRAVAADAFPPAILAALGSARLDGVLHFSRRSAAAFLRCAERAGLLNQALKLAHYCVSGQVAAPLADAGAATVRVAARPEEAAVLALI